MRWIGEDTKVEIPVRGFLRRTGQQFAESAEVPITIVDETAQGGREGTDE